MQLGTNIYGKNRICRYKKVQNHVEKFKNTNIRNKQQVQTGEGFINKNFHPTRAASIKDKTANIKRDSKIKQLQINTKLHFLRYGKIFLTIDYKKV